MIEFSSQKLFTILSNALLALLFVFSSTSHAQTATTSLSQVPIVKTNQSMRDAPVVLGQVTINAPVDGDVIVQFDGYTVSTQGDRIILAASNTTTWGVNDGNVSVEAYNADQNRRSFTHTRSYEVTAGENTFYAVGQNYVETEGTGIASVYGNLSVKYYPQAVADTDPFFLSTGINQSSQNLRGSTQVIASIAMNAHVAGRVLVRFDGMVVSSAGDLIVLAANNSANWEVNEGNTTVEALDGDLNTNPFSHSRVFDVAAGPHTFYAVGENFVRTSGTGLASTYGSLTVEFSPGNGPEMQIHQVPISKTNINLEGAPVNLAQIDLATQLGGKALLRFDAIGIANLGDRIIAAASNTISWGVNSGNVNFEAVSADINSASFSHSSSYLLEPGDHTFYAVGENFVETQGNGIGSFYGHLTLQLFNTESVFSDSFE